MSPVKLTSEQLMEAMVALERGLSCAAWEGVTDRPWWELSTTEQASVLATVRAVHEKRIREMGLDPGGPNKQFLDRMNLTAVQEEDRKWREKWKIMQMARPGTSKPRKIPASGLRMAVNDLLSQEPFFDAGQRRAVERRLAAKSLPSLRILAAQIKNKHAAILKRGLVHNEEEYYLIQEILASVDYPIEEADRNRLAELAEQYSEKRSTS